MKSKIKNILWGVFSISLVIIVVMWFLKNPLPEHIEDTNGTDNYTLQQITEQDVVELNMGSRGSINETQITFELESLEISSGVKYSSDKFTGVYLLYTATIFKQTDIHVILTNFKIHEGNFAFYIVFDREVIGKVNPSNEGLSEFIFGNVNKTASLEYIIAGESASFEFIVPGGFI